MTDDCGCAPTDDVACRLGAVEFRQRMAHIRELTDRALQSRERDDLQLRLTYDAKAAADVKELVGMERECCSFLDFEVDERTDTIGVTITVPAFARASVEEILSEFAGEPFTPA